MKKFEYLKYDPFAYGRTEKDLNALGKEGWEMVGCVGQIGPEYFIFFKREII